MANNTTKEKDHSQKTASVPIGMVKPCSKTETLGKQIAEFIPGGVNSPFRSFHEVGGQAIFLDSGKGSRVFDVDGNQYIDYVGAWGPAILGHAPTAVIDAVKRTIDKGPLFGAPHELELRLAETLVEALPSMDMVRFVNSGTEAVMSAIRLARGYTEKDKLIVFEGCYHGHSDSTLANERIKHSSGVPDGFAGSSIQAEFNNLASVEECLEKHSGEVAAVILEPVTGSMGVIEPHPDFLPGLRSLCTKYDALLIFDEVLTGFRLAWGGAQNLYDVKPDLSTFGKTLGGGMPIGAYGGRREIMNCLMPIGKVYQAGTFSGNPLTMAGGLAMLNELKHNQVYETLENRAERLFTGLEKVLNQIEKEQGKRPPIQLQRVGSMFTVLFAEAPVENFKDAGKIDEKLFARFFHHCLKGGVYLPPTAVDAACLSSEHSEEDIDRTIEVMGAAIGTIFQ